MKNHKNEILALILCVLIGLFLFSLFKNIAYPLLWNDETETVIFAERILQYGYPKADDGKNLINMMGFPSTTVIDEKTGAYIGTAWGHFYFSVIGNRLASGVNDIYAKTALLRTPFALIGLAGLAIMVFTIAVFFKDTTYRLLFLIFFAFFELLSVSLVLHMREARYCSLLIFMCALIIYLYMDRSLVRRINIFLYIISMSVMLILLFNTFMPAYFSVIATMVLAESFQFLKRRSIKGAAVNMAPILVSFAASVPELIFFRTFHISRECAEFLQITPRIYVDNVTSSFNRFRKYEYLELALVAKAILASFLIYAGSRKGKDSGVNNIIKEMSKYLYISNILTLLLVVYFFIITKMPISVIYTRHFIVLQPILVIVLLLDTLMIYQVLKLLPVGKYNATRLVFVLLFIGLFGLTSPEKIRVVHNHIYELTHQYKGPLDFVIPYLEQKYRHAENLIIATNYEEGAYTYYLGSKTIIGYVGANLQEDLKLTPDVIIIRKRFAFTNIPIIFNTFVSGARYRKISFPVFDSPVNNMPEMDSHLFATKVAANPKERLDVYVREEN